MSISFGFYNSLEGDRTYDAVQMSSIFDGVISDGVFATVGDAFAITAMGGKQIGIGKGRAWFNHTWTYNDSVYLITLGDSEVLQHRIDTVVLEVNDLIRANRILVLEGDPSSTSPSSPELTNTSNVHQYPLALIYRGAGTSSVTQADITNKIGTNDCPFVTGLIDTIDIDMLVAQWESQYNNWISDAQGDIEDWFDNMKDQLSTDAAVNLQNQIGNLSNLDTSLKTDLVSAINETVDELDDKLPLTGGTVTGQIKSTFPGTPFLAEHGIASQNVAYGAKRTDTGVGMFSGIGSGGINHGVYSNKLSKWMLYGDATRTHIDVDAIYPIGSIYMSVNNTNPATYFGGTWEQIKDTFLLACGTTYANGATGGEASHTLTTTEMPAHRHRTAIGNASFNLPSGSDNTFVSNYGYRTTNSYYTESNGLQTSSVGGGAAHNNMPPYLAVYVWKRTA